MLGSTKLSSKRFGVPGESARRPSACSRSRKRRMIPTVPDAEMFVGFPPPKAPRRSCIVTWLLSERQAIRESPAFAIFNASKRPGLGRRGGASPGGRRRSQTENFRRSRPRIPESLGLKTATVEPIKAGVPLRERKMALSLDKGGVTGGMCDLPFAGLKSGPLHHALWLRLASSGGELTHTQ